ncbi:MAG TPA: CdaR family protein [Bacteroidota bacterium]|nr:CdaR family protein [Bacteroidota bacterium]
MLPLVEDGFFISAASLMKNKNFHIAFFSTLFAAALWLSVNMGYEYQTVVSVPLILENIKPNKALAKPVPSFVSVKVRATGWQLAGMYFVPDVRYVLDVSDISNKYNFVTNKDLIVRLKMPQRVRTLEVKPDTIAVLLDEKIKKVVPVEPVVAMSFHEGYGIVGEIKSSPDSVSLSGAKGLLDKIDRWRTDQLTFADLKNGVNARVGVSDTLAFSIVPSPSTVNIQIDVQPIAEKSFKGIPVEVNDVPGNRVVVLIPPKIDIIVRGGIEEIAAVEQKDFSSYIDYKSILLDTTGSLRPTVTTPKNIKIVQQDPELLQYVVRK